jgi:hypothetical protein
MAYSAPSSFAANEMVSFVTDEAAVDTSPHSDLSAATGILISCGIGAVFWMATSYAIQSIFG